MTTLVKAGDFKFSMGDDCLVSSRIMHTKTFEWISLDRPQDLNRIELEAD